MKKQGFTLLEMVLSMVIFSMILLIFSSMVSFNYRFTRMSMETDDIIQDYVANNTFIYKKLRESKTITLEGQKLTLDTCTFEIKNNKLYYDAEPIYELYDTSEITYVDGLLEMKLNIKNGLEQKVTIAIKK